MVGRYVRLRSRGFSSSWRRTWAVHLVVRILSAQGYFNAFAGIALPNPASVALHERVGFSSRSASTAMSATSLAPGMMSGGGRLSLRKHEISAAGATGTSSYSEAKQLGSALALGLPCHPRQGGVSDS